MEVTKRERIILYGAVPIAAAIIGALATAWFTHQGGDATNVASFAQITADRAMTAAQKLKAIELINKNDEQFYELIRTGLIALTVPGGAIAFAAADWIRNRSR